MESPCCVSAVQAALPLLSMPAAEFVTSASADGLQGADMAQISVSFTPRHMKVWVEIDHNTIKFQSACLLCLLPCMYKQQKKLPTISLQGFISLHPLFPFLALHSVAAIRRKPCTQIMYYLLRLT